MKTTHNAVSITFAALGLLLACTLAVAQTEPAAKTAKAAAVSSKTAVKAAKKKPVVSANRTNLKSDARNMAAGIEAAEAAMTPAELAIAERVQVGQMPCELGASVTLAKDPKAPGYFDMQGKNFKYRLSPVVTSTGAIRLEDPKAGAVWLQLANKSMLMNQKLGIRLADECMSPAQVAVAESMKLNPPVGLLDAPKPVAIPAAVAAVASPTPASAPKLPVPVAQ